MSREPEGAAGHILVTNAVSEALRELWRTNRQAAQSVDDAIGQIPHGAGVPVRIDVPGAPEDREYLAIVPRLKTAPAVIYRNLEPGDSSEQGWLVTTLVDRSELGAYRLAEQRGILDLPVVRHVTSSVAGTASSIAGGQISGVDVTHGTGTQAR